MTIRHKLLLIIVILTVISTSCVSKKKMTYLQARGRIDNLNMTPVDPRLNVTPATYKIMPYDNLYIRVLTPDPQWSAIFNSMPVGQGGGILTQESAALLGYPVDSKGYIEVPYVGFVEVAGKTLMEITTRLDSVFKNYVNNAAITVRLVNNNISIIGEVERPGRYPLSKDVINVFDALSMAGDIREFGNRQKVELIRSTKYGPVIKEFSVNDRSILASEDYYVMPNDILYVKPLHGRFFQINTAFYNFLLSTLTSSILIYTFIHNLNQ